MSAVNVTMPVFAAERRRLLLIVFSCPWGTQQQTRCRYQWDRQTKRLDRFIDTLMCMLGICWQRQQMVIE